MKKNIMLVLSGEITSVDGEIKILPMGHVESLKGDFIVDEESVKLMHKAFKDHGVDIVVDYEHQTLEGTKAPAGGWIKDFYIKDGAVVAKIEWTQKAKDFIKNKEYRYLSPVILVRKSDKKVIELHSVALTNTPAIDCMYPIINSTKINPERNDFMELLEELKEMLGLGEDASQEDVIARLKEIMTQANSDEDPGDDEDEKTIENDEDVEDDADDDTDLEANDEDEDEDEDKDKVVSNKSILRLLGLRRNAGTKEITNKIMSLKNPGRHVTTKQFYALKRKFEAKEADDLVLRALKQGKISAAQKAWAKEYALKSPEGFKDYLKNASVVVPLGELKTNKQKAVQPTELDMKVCKMLGLSQADLKKYGKDAE